MKSDSNDPKSISARIRAYRIRQFDRYATNSGIKNASVLDLGGTFNYWKMNAPFISKGLIKSIDIVNTSINEKRTESIAGMTVHLYSGNALDRTSLQWVHYDIVHSNSVIEHVGNLRLQKRMADLIREIGEYYWIQTPAKSFPLEPHFYFPFFAYLPLSIRTLLHMKLNLGFKLKNSIWLESRMECEETRLLTKTEFKHLFKEGHILEEKLIGMCKSYIATNMALNLQNQPGRISPVLERSQRGHEYCRPEAGDALHRQDLYSLSA